MREHHTVHYGTFSVDYEINHPHPKSSSKSPGEIQFVNGNSRLTQRSFKSSLLPQPYLRDVQTFNQ